MKRKHKLLSAFLAVCMVITMLPTVAFADEPASPDWSDVVFATLNDTDTDNKQNTVIANGKADANDKNDKGVYVVDVSGQSLKMHKNSSGKDAYWVGIGVPYDNTKYDYYFDWVTTKDTIPDITNATAESSLSKGNVDGKDYAMFYWNAGNTAYNQGYIVVTDKNKKTENDIKAKYLVNLSDVEIAKPTAIKALHFKADSADANAGRKEDSGNKSNSANNDSGPNTMWLTLNEYNGTNHAVVEVTDPDGKKLVQMGAEAGRYTTYAWAFGKNNTQIKNPDGTGAEIKAGTYNVEFKPLKFTLFGDTTKQWSTSATNNSYVGTEQTGFWTWVEGLSYGDLAYQYLINGTNLSSKIDIAEIKFEAGEEEITVSDNADYFVQVGDTAVKAENGYKSAYPLPTAPEKENCTFSGWVCEGVNDDAPVKDSAGLKALIKEGKLYIFVPKFEPIVAKTVTDVKSDVENDILSVVGDTEANITTNIESKDGKIQLSGVIQKPDADGTKVTLTVKCTKDKCTDHQTTEVTLTYKSGELLCEPSSVKIHDIDYVIDVKDVEVLEGAILESAPADTAVAETIPNEDKEAVEEALNKSEADISDVLGEEPDVLKELVDVANNVNVEEVLKDPELEGYTDVEVETYLKITAEEYVKSGDNAHLTVDITPMYKLVATKADSDNKDIVGTEQELKTPITKAIDLKVGVPSDFFNLLQPTNAPKAYVIHKNMYIYDGTGEDNAVTFRNTHGFSEFAIYAQSPAVAVICDVDGEPVGDGYFSLKDAIDNVKDGQTIKLLKDSSEIITVNRQVKFNLNTDDAEFTGNIVAGPTVKNASDKAGEYNFVSKTGDNQPGGDDNNNPSRPGNGQVTPGGNGDDNNPPAGTTNYKVNLPASVENGVVTADKAQAAKGDKVTLTVKANDGYDVDTVTVTDKDGKAVEVTKNSDGTYSFTMPESDVTVAVSFKKSDAEPEDTVCKPYTDVVPTEWYHPYVHYMIENGYMTGTETGKFSPDMTLNRAMVAQILYAKAGKPTVSAITNRFSDVKSGDWYAEAVTWASENGVTAGYANGTFRPYNAVTREELAVMIYGDAGKSSVTGTLSAYPDYQSVSDWAVSGVTWAVQNKVISGVEQADKSVTLSPNKGTKRSEAATMFMQYFTNVKK